MTTIFIVASFGIFRDSFQIEGVFSTMQKAKNAIKNYNNPSCIVVERKLDEEFATDDPQHYEDTNR